MKTEAIRLLEYHKIKRLLANMTSTVPGRQLAGDLEPMDQPRSVQQAVCETAEMVEARGNTFHTPMAGIEDVKTPVSRAAAGGGPLETSDFLRIAKVCQSGQTIGDRLKRLGTNAPHLRRL